MGQVTITTNEKQIINRCRQPICLLQISAAGAKDRTSALDRFDEFEDPSPKEKVDEHQDEGVIARALEEPCPLLKVKNVLLLAVTCLADVKFALIDEPCRGVVLELDHNVVRAHINPPESSEQMSICILNIIDAASYMEPE